MKGILEFNLPEEREEFETAVKAGKYSAAIDEIGNEVFRPARKHGYGTKEIQDLIDKNPEDATELISLLEDKFYEILRSYEVI
jgi:hypothetical protein